MKAGVDNQRMVWQDWQQWSQVWGQVISRVFAQAGQNRAIVVSVNLLLLLGVSYQLADLSWRLLPRVEQAALPLPPPDVSVRQQQPFNPEHWHLFGEVVTTPQGGVPRVVPMPETRLKLILRGVVSGVNGTLSGAIIADPSGTQSFYRLGADLPGGAVLKEVHERHIVLMRNGSLETLRLPENELMNVGDGNDAMGSRRADETAQASAAQPLMSLREYRDTLLENPQQLVNVVQARPYHRNGITGYQINPGRDAALFSQLGLQPNDVITAVNGIRLDNPARGLNVLQTLTDDASVKVEVIRGGVPRTLTVNLDQ